MATASVPHVTKWESRVASGAGRQQGPGGHPTVLQLCGSEWRLPLSGPQFPSL